jgi:site-specific DNA-adenine methylase
MATIYKKTATKANNGKIYAFGRQDELNGQAVEKGGYILFTIKTSYNGQVRGGLEKRWVVVKDNMSFADAIALMNVKCGYNAFGE